MLADYKNRTATYDTLITSFQANIMTLYVNCFPCFTSLYIFRDMTTNECCRIIGQKTLLAQYILYISKKKKKEHMEQIN